MSITIFLADDHAVVREGLKVLLEAQQDLKVIGDATNGRDAVQQISRLCPDIAILDITMPDLDGIEVAKQVRSTHPHIRIIILSMHATPEHIFRALQVGAQGYLLKESAGAEVVNAIRAVHAGQRYLGPKISNGLINDYLRRRNILKAKNPLPSLNSHELDVLRLVVKGQSSSQIAGSLSLPSPTIETYRSRLKEKLGVDHLPDLVKFAIQYGLLPLE